MRRVVAGRREFGKNPGAVSAATTRSFAETRVSKPLVSQVALPRCHFSNLMTRISRLEQRQLLLRVGSFVGIWINLHGLLELLACQPRLTRFRVGHSEVIVNSRAIRNAVLLAQSKCFLE